MKNKLQFIILAFALFTFPIVNYGQAPNLGAASSFALFTADGAFSNIGATNITGDIGTNAGALSGFPPGIVAGTIHSVPDATTAQAATDVINAYSSLTANTCGTDIGAELGSQLLTQNTYCTIAASTLTGDLILDGQGNPNALFIFKIGGKLTTSTSSNIILINSACLCNVYWQINGAVELGVGSVFKGSIIANGSITLLDGSSLDGRGLSIAGAISLNNNTNSLPIELLSFTAHQDGANVQLNWSTTSETNNDYFTIQRSMDGISFEEVVQIRGAENSNEVINYSAIDYNAYDGTSYYRLMQTDFDGKYTYSNLVKVDFVQPTNDFCIYPNPCSTSATIVIHDASQIKNFELKVYTILGTEVLNTILTKELTILETGNLSPGIYYYKLVQSGVDGVVGNSKTLQSGKLISKQ